ncbi:MAG TPA: hypothetical protein VGB00_19380 [Pyrinomonadaceae bacterium]
MLNLTLLFFWLQNADLVSPATVSMVERLGFPTAIALLSFFFLYMLVNRLLDEHKTQNELLRSALKENTVELKKMASQFSKLSAQKPADNVYWLKRRKSTPERNSQTL